MTDTQLHKPKSPDTKRRDDIHEIMLDLDSLKAELDQEEETEWVPMETVRASREVMPVPEERTELSDMHGIQFHGEYPDDAEFQENVTEVVPDLETPKTKLSEIHDEYLKEDPLSNMAKDDSSIFKKADRPKIGGERTGSGGVTFSDPVLQNHSLLQHRECGRPLRQPVQYSRLQLPSRNRRNQRNICSLPFRCWQNPVEPEREIPGRNWQIPLRS